MERIHKSAEKEFKDRESAIRKANRAHEKIDKNGKRTRKGPSRSGPSEYTNEEKETLESLGPGDDFFRRRGFEPLLFDEEDGDGDYSGPNVFRHGRGRGMDDGVEASLAGRYTSNQGRNTMPDVRIPSRYAHAHAHASSSTSAQTSFGFNYRSTYTSTPTYSSQQESDQFYRDEIRRKMEYVRSHRDKHQSQAESLAKKAAQEAEYMRQVREAEKEERRREKREKERRKRDREQVYEEEERKKRRGSTPIFDHFGAGSGDHMNRDRHSGPSTSTSASDRPLRREKERERYLSRWKSLLAINDNDKDNFNEEDNGDGIEETELSFSDIPWPTYRNTPLDMISIKTFLSSFTSQGSNQKDQERKIYREAIRNFHPDRFNTKILPRVRESEREEVREGMEICSRVLTGLISDNSASR
jgi:hypothetical protein